MSTKEKNDQVVFNAAVGEGLSPLLASFMVAQANHESAGYSSNVFKSCNNAFGYKHVGQELSKGPCNGSPEGDNYASYDSLEDSSKEVARWIQRRKEQFSGVDTPDEYTEVLKRNGYFGASLSSYQKAMNAFWYPVKGMMNTAVTKYPTETVLTGITFFALVTYYIVRRVKK